MARCLLGLGSNLGDRGGTLRRATSEVAGLSYCQLLARSRWYETAPIGGPTGQNTFLNAALLLETAVEPHQLAVALQEIETRLGRDRSIRWDARSIDIDLLLYGCRRIVTPELQIPHPRMSFRKFVLEPAAEIAGSMVHPLSGWTVAKLLSHLATAPRYVAVCAAESPVSDWLAEELTRALGCLRLEDSCPAAKKEGDSPPRREVEFGQWASIALRRTRWEQDAHLSMRLSSSVKGLPAATPPVVSSFWNEVQRYRTAAERDAGIPSTEGGRGCLTHDETIYPALVIALDPKFPKKFLEKSLEKKMLVDSKIPDIPRSRFRELLDRTGHGPVARIQTDDPAVARHEAIAAVRSVWPELPLIPEE